MDGVLDHGENSVWGECFLAALEAEAFFESDIHELIEKSLHYIPVNSRMYALITDVRRWCEESDDYEIIYGKLMREYGHPDCTNVFQNMGIIIYALLKGKGDLIKTTELAVNAGYDTDCTGATVGAILGLILGANELKKRYDFSDQTFSLGVTARRRSNKISDLAEDICRVGKHFSTKGCSEVQIENCPLMALAPCEERKISVSLSVRYDGKPVVGPKCPGKAVIIIQNHTSGNISGVLKIKSETLASETERIEVCLKAKETREFPVEFVLPENCAEIRDDNAVTSEFIGDENAKYCFGFAGAVPWTLYGPYWENVFQVDTLIPGQSYMEQFPGNTKEEVTDLIRNYHLNAVADIKKPYLDLGMLSSGGETENKQVIYTYEDRIRVSDLVNYEGPCTLFLSRSFYSPEERNCRLYIGYSDAFCLWMNGKKMAERTDTTWWTGENVHLNHVHIKKGMNHMAVRICRRSMESCYSFTFLHNEDAALGLLSFPEHIVDFRHVR